MLPDLDKLETLGEPYEILELAAGETRRITPESWQLGKATIHPRDGREPKTIRVLRVHVPYSLKPTLPHWWDITAQHLVAGMLPWLERLTTNPVVFTVTKLGEGPRARFTMTTEPRRGG